MVRWRQPRRWRIRTPLWVARHRWLWRHPHLAWELTRKTLGLSCTITSATRWKIMYKRPVVQDVTRKCRQNAMSCMPIVTSISISYSWIRRSLVLAKFSKYGKPSRILLLNETRLVAHHWISLVRQDGGKMWKTLRLVWRLPLLHLRMQNSYNEAATPLTSLLLALQ